MASDDSSPWKLGNGDQWRLFLGIGLIFVSYVFRVELVRFTLRLFSRALPNLLVWIKEFEKQLLRPLSWVVFLLIIWLSIYVMDLSGLLRINNSVIVGIVTVLLGIPLVWTVVCFCNYVTWGIIRVMGWDGSKSKDDYSRVMIITEGIGVIKILLVSFVVSSFILDEIGASIGFDTSEIFLVAILMLELVMVFGAHSWLKNIIGGLILLIDEQIKSGAHVRFQGHEGVVERLYLQSFSLRRYDKGLAFFPNGILLENSVEIVAKTLDKRCLLSIHLDHSTPSIEIRMLIQKLDNMLWKEMEKKTANERSRNAVGLLTKLKHRVDMFGIYERARLRIIDDEMQHRRQFWVTISNAYVIEVVFYTSERHKKERSAELTNMALSVIELLEESKVKLHVDKPIESMLENDITLNESSSKHHLSSEQSSVSSKASGKQTTFAEESLPSGFFWSQKEDGLRHRKKQTQ